MRKLKYVTALPVVLGLLLGYTMLTIPSIPVHHAKSKTVASQNDIVTEFRKAQANTVSMVNKKKCKTNKTKCTKVLKVASKGGATEPVAKPKTSIIQHYPLFATFGEVSDSYTFLNTDKFGVPARWDKCTPIGYRVNLANLPNGGLAEIHEAFKIISQLTSYDFVFVGTTDEIPYSTEGWITREQLEDNMIYIAYADEEKVEGLTAGVVGYGGNYPVPTSNEGRRIIRGGMVLDTNNGNLKPWFVVKGRGELIFHELGHVLNLGHTDDPSQSMFGLIDGGPDRGIFQSGDMTGLRVLETLPCFSK